jgi:hypothetical protein
LLEGVLSQSLKTDKIIKHCPIVRIDNVERPIMILEYNQPTLLCAKH